MKLSGDLPAISWVDLVSRMATVDPKSNGGRLVKGSVRVTRVESTGPCPVHFETPLGPMRGYLADEWDLEHFINKYLGLLPDAPLGLTPRIEPGDTVVEVGPWIGSFVRFALSRGAARVIALEAMPVNIECFRMNFEHEISEGRVSLVEAAAWRESGTVRMTFAGASNHRNSNEGFYITDEGEFEVPAVTIDEALAKLDVEGVDFINMDIEGAERHALAGAAGTIRRDRPELMVCMHHLLDDEEAIQETMREIAPEAKLLTDGGHARFITSISGLADAMP